VVSFKRLFPFGAASGRWSNLRRARAPGRTEDASEDVPGREEREPELQGALRKSCFAADKEVLTRSRTGISH